MTTVAMPVFSKQNETVSIPTVIGWKMKAFKLAHTVFEWLDEIMGISVRFCCFPIYLHLAVEIKAHIVNTNEH